MSADTVAPTNTLDAQMRTIGAAARAAARVLAGASSEVKDEALRAGADEIRARMNDVLAANRIDLAAAESAGATAAFLDRVRLDAARIEGIACGLEDVAKLADPVGAVAAEWKRPNGLTIRRIQTPIGVIGIIYEARPNVTADAGGLCLKAGNAAILRGGSESFETSRVLVDCLHEGLRAANLPED